MVNRRDFSALGLLSLAAVPSGVAAQQRPVEGRHYVTLSPRQPTRDPRQVEVLEFFAYGCSHCHSFEPTGWTVIARPRIGLGRRFALRRSGTCRSAAQGA